MLLGSRNAGFRVAGNVEWRKPGLYRLVNRVTGHFYIGSSVDLYARFLHHRRRLVLGRHANPQLQKAWDKHGTDAFQFEILLFCRPQDVLLYEQLVLDFYFRTRERELYNIVRSSAAPMAGVKFTPEHKANLSRALKEAYAKRPGLASKRTKQAYKNNPSYRTKVSEGASKAHAERRGTA